MQNNSQQGNQTTAIIYRKIRKRILDNSYPPNTKFKQSELAEEFGVSRTPVTKALHMLEMDGLVDNIPQRGFFIHQVSLREMIDLFMLRQAIEIITASNATQYADLGQIERMKEFFAPFTDTDREIDEEEYYRQDRGFHDYLFSLCDNQLLGKINESLQILTRTYLAGLLRAPAQTLEEHLQLIGAIENHDVQRAQILALQHIDATMKSIKKAAAQLTALGVDTSGIAVRDYLRSGMLN